MNGTLNKFFEKHGMQIIVQTMGVALGVLIAYFGIKQDLTLLTRRVDAVEVDLSQNSAILGNIDVVQGQITDMKEDIREIKSDIKTLIGR